MDKIKLTIDGKKIEVSKDKTVLQACKEINIYIPSLCYLKDVNCSSACRVCLVEANGRLLPSCSLQVEEGMNIITNSKKAKEARRTALKLLLSDHNRDCTTCIRNENCELQNLASKLNINKIEFEGESIDYELDISSDSIVRDPSKCIKCGRCVQTCNEIQSVGAIDFSNRGFYTKISPSYDVNLGNSVCINCGQCIVNCPVGALYEKDSIEIVKECLYDENKYVVVQTAPAVRAGLGEEFGMDPSLSVTYKMASALKKLGFDKVFDTNFAADLTIVEEGTELLNRLENNKNLPLMTSCCPGWVKFVEHNFPEMLDNLSTCKSPHEMEGALIKSYFAKKLNVDPNKIVVVSIMPCTAKKFEANRNELICNELKDVDYVLTTRELGKLIKEEGIDFKNLEDSEFDNPFGESTGASVIFGVTGGVAEAALRTIFELTCDEPLKDMNFTPVRGDKGIKEANITLPNGVVVQTVVISGLSNARKVMNDIMSGKKNYQFIEVMACPGGCINGGGQPIVNAQTLEDIDVRKLRTNAIYNEDEGYEIRQSHKNPQIKRIYDEFLKEANGHIAHKYLHTHYQERSKI